MCLEVGEVMNHKCGSNTTKSQPSDNEEADMRRVVMALVMTGRFRGPAQNKRRKTKQCERRKKRSRSRGVMWEGREPEDRDHAARTMGSKEIGGKGTWMG